MYKKVSSNMDFCSREAEILEFWKENQVFEKSVEKNNGKESFSFYDGPPTANGKPHIGHILTRVMKDIIPRYKTMKGYHVLRKAGWDTHGLPVELEVEKSLGIDGKQEIEKYGIEPFINKCKESVWKYKGEWEKMSDRVGYWVDMDSPYITYDDKYIESVWWSLKQIADKDLIYKGHKIVPYCPRCGTALSSHEVAQGYKTVKEKSIFVKFAIKGEKNAYILAWTTTPWTLPSNVALCMNPDEDYCRIKVGDEQIVMAKALISSLFEEYEIISTAKGIEYEGMEYQPLFDCYHGDTKAHYVVCDTYVTLSDGSGVVHIAPAFGEDDAAVGKRYGLPFVQMVDERGKFVDDVKDLGGVFCKDGDKLIIRDLKERGLLLKELMYEHSYPFCWRCDTPLLYYARKSWFIKMTEVKEQLLENNASVNWIPPTIGTGRMGNFLENVIDWGISRERYWGTPLPIWVCEDCGNIHVIGSKQELREMSGSDTDVELHKPYIDEVAVKCPKCSGTMKRTPEVIDCWFDSGSMPFAQWHYPFENKETFDTQFPADFISEAVDQTRGWFYTLLAISTLVFGRAPFKNCIVLGHVNDKDGIKMSKHKGNVVDPWSVLDVQGADAVRWYFYTSSAPWLPSRFSADNVSEIQRKFLGTLWNTYAFYVLYADIDNYDPSKYDVNKCELSLMDNWILSGLNSLIKTVDEGLDEYKITESARAIQDFVDNLSNWYVRRCRDRYWGSEMTADKIAAYATLHHVLVSVAKISAPFVPFIAESIYSNLVTPFYTDAPLSVHLCDFPLSNDAMINKDLEEDMEYVLDAVAIGRACRNDSGIKNRQPLKEAFINADRTPHDLKVLELIADELNVKNVSIIKNSRNYVKAIYKPKLGTLGPKYGKSIGVIREYLAAADTNEIADDIASGVHKAIIGGMEYEFNKGDIIITTSGREGYSALSDKCMDVIINTVLDDELIEEGILRELVSKLQTMRKDAGLEVMDRININYVAEGLSAKILAQGDNIKGDVLCDNIVSGDTDGYAKDWNINGDKVKLIINKV